MIDDFDVTKYCGICMTSPVVTTHPPSNQEYNQCFVEINRHERFEVGKDIAHRRNLNFHRLYLLMKGRC